MNRIMTTFIIVSSLVAAGCGSGAGAGGGDVLGHPRWFLFLTWVVWDPADIQVKVRRSYTSEGVTCHLGHNNCDNVNSSGVTVPSGWEPGMVDSCWLPTQADGRGGICGVLPPTEDCSTCPAGQCACMPTCGTYAPGTLRVWSMDDPRYKYLGDPTEVNYTGSGGYVCLPNVDPYVIPCS